VSFQQWLKEQSDDEEARNNIGLFIAGGMLTKPAHAFPRCKRCTWWRRQAVSATSWMRDFILDAHVIGACRACPNAWLNASVKTNISLETPMRTLNYDDEGVTINSEHRARYAILAVSPNLYGHIIYVPELPRTQHIMHQHQSMGMVIGVHATYPTPFWRDRGFSDTCFSFTKLVQKIYDNTNHDDERENTILGAMVVILGEETQPPSCITNLTVVLRNGPAVPTYPPATWADSLGVYATTLNLSVAYTSLALTLRVLLTARYAWDIVSPPLWVNC
jgi:putrescine oxidase